MVFSNETSIPFVIFPSQRVKERDDMKVYTVKKHEPNTNREYQAYVDLLEDIRIDIADVPGFPSPEPPNRWLYVWQNKPLAERFARELGARLRDSSWFVHEFDVPADGQSSQRGPLAPLKIVSIPTSEGTEFRLEPTSQERILTHFPNAHPAGKVTFSAQVREDYEAGNMVQFGNQVIGMILTGIPEEAVARLGGVRVVTHEGQLLHERLPVAACR